MAVAAAPSEPKVGMPGDCPACGAPGDLLMIDLAHQHSRSSCRACGETWWTVQEGEGEARVVRS